MTLDQAIDRYTNNAEYERRNGNLQGCLEFKQLSEWLKDYKRLLDQEPFINKPCISTGLCHEDKVKLLDEIRAKIENINLNEVKDTDISIRLQAAFICRHYNGNCKHCLIKGICTDDKKVYEYLMTESEEV